MRRRHTLTRSWSKRCRKKKKPVRPGSRQCERRQPGKTALTGAEGTFTIKTTVTGDVYGHERDRSLSWSYVVPVTPGMAKG